MSKSSDINLFSYIGPDDDLRELVVQTAGPESDRPSHQDTFKFTRYACGLSLKADRVNGGSEDCADINNHSSQLSIYAKEWKSQGLFVFTVKGGSHHIVLSGEIIQGGTEVDVDLGNHSEQSDDLTHSILLDLKKPDGSPVTVRVLIAKKPTLKEGSGPYRYLFPHPDAIYHPLVAWAFKTWFKIPLSLF